MDKQTHNDEIDLVELLVKVVLLTKRNLLQIIIFFLAGTGLGYAYASLASKVYQSKMLVSSDILTESYSEKLIENLQSLIKEENHDVLGAKINLTTDEAKKVNKLEIESALKDKPAKEDEKRFFLITVELEDQSLLSKIEQGLLFYFQENEFVKIRVEQRKNYYDELIKKVEVEIQSLEGFKERIYKGNFFESAKGSVMFDPTIVNSKILELNKEKISLQNGLQLVSSIQVVEGFTKFEKPVWPKKFVSLAAGAALGSFLVGILIAFKSLRKLVRFAEEHPSQKNS